MAKITRCYMCHTWRRRSLIAAVSAAFYVASVGQVSIINAQDAAINPVWTGEIIFYNETRWTPDSQTLLFSGMDVQQAYYQYRLPTRELNALAKPPLTIALTGQQQELFEAADALAFQSFDKQYIIYSSQKQVCGGETGCRDGWALGKLESGEHSIIEKGIGDPNSVFWSEDSTAALIVDVGFYGGVGGVWYISGYAAKVSSLKTELLTNYMAGDHGYVDLSPDGERVIVREQWDENPNNLVTGLRVWDARITHQPQQFLAWDAPVFLPDEQIRGASFIAGDEDHILVVAETGIIRLNMKTQASMLLNSHIRSTDVAWVYFSPDGRYVAVLSRPDEHTSSSYNVCQLFVLPIDFSGDFVQLRDANRCAFSG
ncbi:MAG: hypothetical protein U0528_00340 [Anaerolineae bacterium]